MLTPQQLTDIVDTPYPLLGDLDNFIIKDIVTRMVTRLSRGDGFLLTPTDQWQAEVYRLTGGHYKALVDAIQKFTNKSTIEIHNVFEDAGILSWNDDDAFFVKQGLPHIEFLSDDRMRRLMEDTYVRTMGTIDNFTRTTATASQQRVIKLLDEAHLKVMTGAVGYTRAVADVVDELAKTQTRVLYPTGHTDTIETAVLRAVRTGVAQSCGNMALEQMKERGWDLVRVSAHIGARYGDGGQNPSNHAWWQGGIYSLSGAEGYLDFVSTTGYGTGEGLSGWNCRHSFGPGDPNHNPYENFDAEENKKVYDLSQKQRYLERTIRKYKRQCLTYDTARQSAQDDEIKEAMEKKYTASAIKLRQYNQLYDDFCSMNGLKKLGDRVRIAQWSRSDASKASAQARKGTQ